MRYITAFAMLILTSVQSLAHEMTPTYPELRPSYVDGLYSTKMKLFNRRDDVIYYDIGVFDKDWKQIPFASQDKLIKIEYLEKTGFEIFIRGDDYERVEYICTTSKLLKSDTGKAAVMSRICSKIKRD
jgi:hypothetical protein